MAPQAFSECVDAFLQGSLDVDPGWSLDCQGVVAVVDDSRLSRALIRALRASEVTYLRELPILMITAHHPDDLTGLGSQAENVDVLFKPLLPEHLVIKVQELLRARGGA